MHDRCILDAMRKEVDGEETMFTTFMGGLITYKLDQIIRILIKRYINRSIARS